MSERERIAEELLGCALLPGGFAPCPGRDLHTNKKSGPKDFRVILDGAPTGFCFHSHCGDAVAAFNKELRRRIYFAEHGNSPAPRGHWGEGVAPEPQATVKSRPELNEEAVIEFCRGVPAVDEGFLRRRSPIDVVSATTNDFLSALYADGEKVLIFTDQRSQGDFIAWKRAGLMQTFRLSQQRGVKAVPSKLPVNSTDGVWFLVQPVTGKWEINSNSVKGGGDAKWSRRSEGNVTAWRYYVLESDELAPDLWLRVVANLPMPIAAIYTSGGRSVHALVKCPVSSKAEWDMVRNALRQFVCPLGADPAALTAVRLSRAAQCRRNGRPQKLLYLDADPQHVKLWLKPEVRP